MSGLDDRTLGGDIESPDWEVLHNTFKVSGLDKAHLKFSDIHPHINALAKSGMTCQQIGCSFEARPIFQLTLGTGPIKVLAWSQMHGDEPTATAALLDVLHCLNAQDAPWCRRLLNTCTLHLVPMLNPDGAEARKRVNAQGLDINRDARALQSPEGRLLRELLRGIRPDFAFNLHDQNRYYAAGKSKMPSVMAFLAPPGDEQETLSPHRRRAVNLIGHMVERLGKLLPQKMARYEDGFSARAFGDFACSTGASTILIESGYDGSDNHRQLARTGNFVALLHALDCLFRMSELENKASSYFSLPVNRENGFCDLIVRQAKVMVPDGESFCIDIGIQFDEFNRAVITEIGDLLDVAGYFELEARELVVKSLPREIRKQLNKSMCERIDEICPEGWENSKETVEKGRGATFVLCESDQPRYIVVAGRCFDVKSSSVLNAYTL